MFVWKIAELARYGMDPVDVILKKIHNLQVTGLTFEQAVTTLEDYYKEKRKD